MTFIKNQHIKAWAKLPANDIFQYIFIKKMFVYDSNFTDVVPIYLIDIKSTFIQVMT